mmetsp:Transcript_91402/g.295673  ORF Transcript_91402/g.295673 Transcript_91402/m.295673 type:complete len:161 (+) Transcript_91402:55-537(+)
MKSRLTGVRMRPSQEHPFGSHKQALSPGHLALHQDASMFAKRSNPNQDRRVPRVNVLLYIGDLKDNTTGHLEIWGADPETGQPNELVVSVAPRKNRLLLFDTIDNIHGMPWPLRGDDSRRHLQWYFHAVGEPGTPGPLAETVHFDRPRAGWPAGRRPPLR